MTTKMAANTALPTDYKALAEYKPVNKVRFVTAASLFDGHDAAINIMRRILMSMGTSDSPGSQPQRGRNCDGRTARRRTRHCHQFVPRWAC